MSRIDQPEGIYVNGTYVVPRILDDVERSMLDGYGLSPCEPGHDYYDGECQRCGDLHPDDCLGCAPMSRAAHDHEYDEPNTYDAEFSDVSPTGSERR